MATTRRNAISEGESRIVLGLALVSGVVAAFAGCQPTGQLVPDIVLTVGLAVFVTWIAASAPWWALLVAATLAVGGSLGGPVVLTVLAVAAAVVVAWIGFHVTSQPVLRAAAAGVSLQVLYRLELDPFFTFSAVVAAVAVLVVSIAGVRRRPRDVRRRVVWSAVGVAVLGVLAVAGVGITGMQQRGDLTDGYQSLLDGLEHLQDGDAPAARRALFDAADQLGAVSDGFAGPLAQPARLVPGVAQNRNAAVGVLDRAAESATAAAQALGVVDLERLRVENGLIDTAAFGDLLEPFRTLEATVAELRVELYAADSPWLVAPLQERLDSSRDRVDQVARQSVALTAAARYAPAMLGADEPRRYFLAFVNPAEARAHSGLMGNWSELTIDDGRLLISRSGRTAELQRTLADRDVFLDQPPEFFDRLGARGGGEPPEIGVGGNLWVNITGTPHMPTVGRVMADLYEVYAGYPVDGVFVIDPAGIAALLAITGPIEIDGIDQRLDAGNVEQFLVLDQYEFAEADREDVLEEVTVAAIERVLTSTLPPPQELAASMADAALHGHISGWAARPGEQQVFELVGMDASIPRLGTAGFWDGDALAVVNENANPNKIDSFLERDIRYDVEIDEATGELTAALRIELTNTAPGTGFEPYVIGNNYDLPFGTNRTVLNVFSPHDLVGFRIDGQPQSPPLATELGWNVWNIIVQISPGESVVAEVDLAAELPAGGYRLFYRPQPLPNVDDLEITVRDTAGRTILRHDDPIVRRSLLTADGIQAWR